MGTQVSDLHVYELFKCLNRSLEHADDLHIIQEKQKGNEAQTICTFNTQKSDVAGCNIDDNG